MENNNILYKLDKLMIFFILYTLIFMLFFKSLKYILPFVLAFIFALILKNPTRYLIDKLKIKLSLASIITTFIFFVIIITISALLVIAVTSEIVDLTKHLQQLLNINTSSIYTYIEHLQNSPLLFNIKIDPTILDGINSAFSGSVKSFINNIIDLTSSFLQMVFSMIGYIPYVIMTIIFTLLSTYFFTKEISCKRSKRFLEKNLPNNSSTKLFEVIYHSRKMILNYCLSTLFLITTSMLLTFIGFSLLGIDYSLILSLLSGLLDLLPVVGMILVYIPLICINFVSGNYMIAISLIALYIFVIVIRQLIEPKVMSSSLGINPVASLCALFIGLQTSGFSGVIFLISLIVFYNILKKVQIL